MQHYKNLIRKIVEGSQGGGSWIGT